MIKSFKGKLARDVFDGTSSKEAKRFDSTLHKGAKRKLDLINGAKALVDLMVPPGNRLEALRGDRKGCHSIRINDQWRIVFRWNEGDAEDVEIVDYH